MKPRSERLKGYIALLKTWKEYRSPSPADLAAWQEIWTIEEKDLELVEEMGRKAQTEGRRAFKTRGLVPALELWEEAWSLTPRDKDFFQEVLGYLREVDREELRDYLQRYELRTASLTGPAPLWTKIQKKTRQRLAASILAVPIVAAFALAAFFLLPLLWKAPPPPPPAPPSGAVRPLPVQVTSSPGLGVQNASSQLILLPESQFLSVQGKLVGGDPLVTDLQLTAQLTDEFGRVVAQRSWEIPDERPLGNQSVHGFSQSFSLNEPGLDGVRRVSLRLTGGQMVPWDEKVSLPLPLVNEGPGEFRSLAFRLTSNQWTRESFSWRNRVLLECRNAGLEPVGDLRIHLIWKDVKGEVAARREVLLNGFGKPSLEAGESTLFSLVQEFPEEVWDFQTRDKPLLTLDLEPLL